MKIKAKYRVISGLILITTYILLSWSFNKGISSQSLKVLVFATNSTPQFCTMAHSVLYNEASLTVDGFNEEYDDVKARKPYSFYEMSKKEAAHSPNQLLAFIDAYDVIMLQKSYHAVENFLNIGAPIVYNGEKNCWPFILNYNDSANKYFSQLPISERLSMLYGNGTSPHFLNSGGMICRAKDCVQWFNESLHNKPVDFTNDDQAIAFSLCAQWGGRCVVDAFSSIFQGIFLSAAEFQLRNGVYTNTITNSVPVFLHFNGDKSMFPYFADRQEGLTNHVIPNDMKFFDFSTGEEKSLNSVCSLSTPIVSLIK